MNHKVSTRLVLPTFPRGSGMAGATGVHNPWPASSNTAGVVTRHV